MNFVDIAYVASIAFGTVVYVMTMRKIQSSVKNSSQGKKTRKKRKQKRRVARAFLDWLTSWRD